MKKLKKFRGPEGPFIFSPSKHKVREGTGGKNRNIKLGSDFFEIIAPYFLWIENKVPGRKKNAG